MERKNQHRPKRTPLMNIMEKDKSREYSWKFFYNYTTTNIISKIYYHNSEKNYYLVSTRCKEWKAKEYFVQKEGKIQKLRNKEKNNNTYPSKQPYYMFNLNPFYEFAKSKKIEFTPKQEKILDFFFYSYVVREYIYDKYSKEDDFITAMIKFYISFLIRNKLGEETYSLDSLKKEFKKYFKTHVLGIGSVDYIRSKFVHFSTDKAIDEDGVTLLKDERMMITDVNAIYSYYKEFHLKLKEEMIDLDFKMLELLGIY